jgi:arylformamidase
VDAPLHYLKDGEDVASLSPEKLIGLCRVVDFTNIEEFITEDDIVGMDFSEIDFVLFKTRNSIESRPVDFVYIDASAAEILKGKNLKGVGIDALGIERNQEGHPTHKTLLKEGLLIIEGLVLKNVSPGEYLLIVLPLKIRSAEAAPARALLIKDFTEWG